MLDHVQYFEDFMNEGIDFTEVGLKNKLEDKLRFADIAIEKWGGEYYEKQKNRIKDVITAGKLDWKKPLIVTGDSPRQRYDIFDGSNATELVTVVANVIDKWKKAEVNDSSMPAAGGWSGTMKSSVSGAIKGHVNFSNGKNSYLVAVTIGGGINNADSDKIKDELYPLFFMLDQFNSTDGGVHFNIDSGTNYDTIGLTCSEYKFSDNVANKLTEILNK